MKNHGRAALALLLVAVPAGAYAYTDTNRTLNTLGTSYGSATASNYGYFSVLEGFSATCTFGYVYVDLATDFGKASYATLLTAKSTGRILTRIDYAYVTRSDGLTLCMASDIEVQI
jgi:hypothetical protein